MSRCRRPHHLASSGAALLIVGSILTACAAPAAAPTAAPTATPPPPPTATTAAPTATATPAPFELTSPAFAADADIPVRYSCAGENISPPLAWSGVPAGTVSLTLIMDDPDAVAVVGQVYDHWLLFNIPAETAALEEAVPLKNTLADGSQHGRNSGRLKGYAGPCPPAGPAHRYSFRLYALDTRLTLESGASKEALLAAMDGHILAQAELVGQFAAP